MTARLAEVSILLVVLGSPAPGYPAPRRTCTVRTDGTLAIQETVVALKRKAGIVLDHVRTHDASTGEDRIVSTLRRGRTVVHQQEMLFPPGGSVTLIRRLGRGFKGLREVRITADAGTVQMTADGRPVSTAALDASPPAVAFADGLPPPRLRVKRDVVRLLRRAAREPPPDAACPDAGPSPRKVTVGPQDECDVCILLCGVETYLCSVRSLGVESLLSLLSSSWGCAGVALRCSNECNAPGHECCRVHCGTNCCGRVDPSQEIVCIGETAEHSGLCCYRGGECGPGCCDQGRTCADPTTGDCCSPREIVCGRHCCPDDAKCGNPEKSLCCDRDAGEGCGGACCPAGQRCKHPHDEPDFIECVACPPERSGPVCGDTCCAPGEICDGVSCCPPEQTCGGVCCAAGFCLNGSACCAPPSHVCGGSCCDPFATCCNGTCCPELGDRCIAGSCCPESRACGPSCCPDGYTCTDDVAGTCTPCPPGNDPCRRFPGNPPCCPAGSRCCGNGECCGPGTLCCGDPPSCRDEGECLPR